MMTSFPNVRTAQISALILFTTLLVLFAGPISSAAAATYCLYLPITLAPNNGMAGAAGTPAALCPPTTGLDEIVDFNGDGYADLAIGVPEDNFSVLVQDSGAVQVLYGTADGLSPDSAELWTQTMAGGFTQAGELFGTAVTAADFNGDGYTDLAIGAPGERVNGTFRAGQVNILYGTASGLSADNAQSFSQGIDGIAGATEEEDRFGQVLTAGDYNGDGYADLVVGVPFESYEAGGIADIGAVNVIYGSSAGLTSTGNEIIHQALPGVDGTPTAGDWFGYALETGDFDGDGMDDLAVGIPGYDVGGSNEVGVTQVFYGSENGVAIVGEQLWRQGFGNIQGVAEQGDRFGMALAVGDFDRNGVDDLAIGSPGEDVSANGIDFDRSGAVNVLYGYKSAGGLSSSGNQIWHQGMAEVFGQAGDLNRFGRALVAADFNGDGAADLAIGVPGETVTASGQGVVHVLYSNGSILSASNQDLWVQDLLVGVGETSDFFGQSLGTADFDADGYADLVVGVYSEDVLFDAALREDAGVAHTIYGTASGLSAAGNQLWQQGNSGLPGTPEAGDLFGFALTR